MAGLGSLWEPKLCFSGEQDPAVTFQWFPCCVSADWLHPVRAEERWSVECESVAAPGVDWTGISAKSQLFYLAPSVRLCVSSPFIHSSKEMLPCHRENKWFFQCGLACLELNFFSFFPKHHIHSLPFAWVQSIILPETSILACWLLHIFMGVYHRVCVCVWLPHEKPGQLPSISSMHDLYWSYTATVSSATTESAPKLQEPSRLLQNKTHYLSSFAAMVMGTGWDDAMPNEADSNLGHTVMNGWVIKQH